MLELALSPGCQFNKRLGEELVDAFLGRDVLDPKISLGVILTEVARFSRDELSLDMDVGRLGFGAKADDGPT